MKTPWGQCPCVTKENGGLVVGFRNFAWAPIIIPSPIKKNYWGDSPYPPYYTIFGRTKGGPRVPKLGMRPYITKI